VAVAADEVQCADDEQQQQLIILSRGQGEEGEEMKSVEMYDHNSAAENHGSFA